MPLMRIVKIPAGEAPEEVRREWVGLELNFFIPSEAMQKTGQSFGLVSLEPIPERKKVLIPQEEAIQALFEKNPRAAQWFVDAGYPTVRGIFSFGLDEVELVDKPSTN